MALSARIGAMLEGVEIALDAIRANKVRAGLTILGIAIGVFSVTAMAAAIYGFNQGFAKDIESAGATTFFVTRWPIFASCDGTDEGCPWRHNPGTSFAELTAIGRLPSVQAVSGEIDFNGSFKNGDHALSSAQLTAYTPGWEQMAGGDIAPGRSFTIQENASAARVVMLNDIAVKGLFGDSATDPVGRSITIDNSPYEVIGYYHYHPSFFAGGEHAIGIIPIETMIRHYKVNVKDIWVSVRPAADVPRDQAIDDVVAFLRGARGLRPAVKNNFEIITQDRLFQAYNKTIGVIGLVTLVLSGVGLIVGGVGVIGIMMISVTERTREIGVRKALGATRFVILFQFLVEAVTLTSIGVAIGFVGGWLAAIATRMAFPAIPASVPPLAVALAIVTSIITGILFGVFPAIRASRLDPVTALRYE
jgi:putative ABC transport system permease protein